MTNLRDKWIEELQKKIQLHNDIINRLNELSGARDNLKAEILQLQGKLQAVEELKKELDEVPNTVSGGDTK